MRGFYLHVILAIRQRQAEALAAGARGTQPLDTCRSMQSGVAIVHKALVHMP